MEREKKTISLAIVTLLMYGLVSVFGGGPFAFFPINELVFFCLTIYFAFLNFKKSPVSYSLMVAFAGLSLINNQILLSFFFTNEQLEIYLNNILVDYLRISIYAIMFFEIARFFYLTHWKFYPLFHPLIAITIIFAIAFDSSLLLTTAVLFFVLLLFIYYRTSDGLKVYHKSLFYLWVLVLFLKSTTLLTIFLYN